VRIAWRPRGDGVRLEGQDPDSLLRAGIDVAAMIASARDGLTHYATLLWDATKDSPTQRGDALSDIARLVGVIHNPNKLEVVASNLGQMLGVRPDVITRAASRARQAGGRDPRGGGAWPGSGWPWSRWPGPGEPWPRWPGPTASRGERDRRPDRCPDRPPRPAPRRWPRAPTAPCRPTRSSSWPWSPTTPRLLATPQANKAFSLLTDERLRDMYSAARAGASLAVLAPDRLPPAAVEVILAGKYAQSPKPEALLDAKVWELEIAAKKQRSLELDRQLADANSSSSSARARGT
jgi:hypothetical protein